MVCLGIFNGDLTEQLTTGHEIAGVMLRCGFLMMLLIGAWQDMRNHRIKLSLIVISGAAGAVLRCMYIMLDTAIIYQDSGYQLPFGLVAGQLKDTAMAMAVGGGLLFLSWITNEAVGKGDGWFFLISGIYLGAVKNLVLLAGGLGVCFLLSMVLMFKGIIQGTDRGRLRIPLLPFLIPAGIGVMFI